MRCGAEWGSPPSASICGVVPATLRLLARVAPGPARREWGAPPSARTPNTGAGELPSGAPSPELGVALASLIRVLSIHPPPVGSYCAYPKAPANDGDRSAAGFGPGLGKHIVSPRRPVSAEGGRVIHDQPPHLFAQPGLHRPSGISRARGDAEGSQDVLRNPCRHRDSARHLEVGLWAVGSPMAPTTIKPWKWNSHAQGGEGGRGPSCLRMSIPDRHRQFSLGRPRTGHLRRGAWQPGQHLKP